jgi:hypothetical protein
MNPETVSSDSSNYMDEAEKPEVVQVNHGETKLLLPQSSSTESYSTQWQQYGERIAAFIEALPSYVTRFFAENKGPLGSLGLILAVFVTVKLTLALLDAINDIPLVAPTLELIGLVYTTWFVYRYLLSASSRQELSEEVKTLKEQVLGTKS